MEKKKIAMWAVFLAVGAGTAFGVQSAWPGNEASAAADPAGPATGIMVPQTGGDLSTAPDMVTEGEDDGLLPDEVLYISDEPKYDITSREPQGIPELADCIGIEEPPVVGSGMMVPGFDGDAMDMVVEND